MENSPEYNITDPAADSSERVDFAFAEPRLAIGGLTPRLIILDNKYRGLIELTLTGLPAGLKVFLAEAVEINIHDDTPHRGGAIYSTSSVNLHANARLAIIRFHVNWQEPLKSGIMAVMG